MNKHMDNSKEIFARRLQNARKMCGLSQGELVTKMNNLVKENSNMYKSVSTTAIERYENGVMFPESDSIMLTIAHVLGIKTGDLIRPFKVNVDLSKFEFRKKAKLGKKATEAIILKIQERIEKYIEVERLVGIEPVFDVNLSLNKISNTEDARKAAMELRKKWNLGVTPITQPIFMLESFGAKVIEVEEDPDLFDGTSNIVNNIPILVLNKKECTDSKHQNNEERRRLTLFHELAHMILTFSDDIDDKEKEKLCNVFASEMLMPSEVFLRIFGEKRQTISSWELKDVQREYGISSRALMAKAAELDVISQNKYKWFCINLNKNIKLRQYIDQSNTAFQHTSRYERLVYRALASDIITKSKAAEYLGISMTELNNNLNIDFADGNNC